jgi:acyl dehydratase
VDQLAALLRKSGFGQPVVHRTHTASSVLVAEAV